jgi:hypothetical protein
MPSFLSQSISAMPFLHQQMLRIAALPFGYFGMKGIAV